MSSLLIPWTVHEAEVALYPAWKDGMPFRGPGIGRGVPAPLLQCKVTLTMEQVFVAGAPTGHGWTGTEAAVDEKHNLTVVFPDGAYGDEIGRLPTVLAAGGFHILVVRFHNPASGRWTCRRYFYVVPDGDAQNEVEEIFHRTLRLQSSWMQETTGDTGLPAMSPVMLGEVHWICGSRNVRALTYHPVTEVWTSTSENETGDDEGTRYITLTPMTEDEGSDIVLALYLPRVATEEVDEGVLPRLAIVWENTIGLRIGNHDSEYHHGLTLSAGHAVQAVGIPEPLLMLAQDRMLDEAVAVFRYGRRIYATLGHGVFAVPVLHADTAPPETHDPAFRLAVPGDANPETGHSGLTLLPHGAWLDGTVG